MGETVAASRALALLLAVLCAAPSAVRATVLRVRPLEDQMLGSQLVVVGTVTGQQASWEGGLIVTRSIVLVDEIVHNRLGRTPERITVKTMGGEIGRIGLHFSGEARLVLGERYLVFCVETGDDLRITGLEQAALPLLQDVCEPTSPDSIVAWIREIHGEAW